MTQARVFLGCALSAAALSAQTAPPRPAFEVASVKPNKSTDPRGAQMQVLPGGKVVIRNVPLLMIVAAAWNVPFQSPRLVGGKEWEQIREDRFDIEATPPKDAVPESLSPKERGDRIRPMMQALLEDRFRLKMRSETKDQPIYALVVAQGGPKLEKSKMQEADCIAAAEKSTCHRVGGGQGRGIHGDAIDLDDVALFVQNWTDRPVVDRTGLKDLYNIQTEGWAPMRFRPPNPDGTVPKGDARSNDSDRQTLADVFRQLGIAMESQRAPIDMYEIESIGLPAAN
jgi:uncharacterized protein (TIGR03435 family)